jgi:hypothetical protein
VEFHQRPESVDFHDGSWFLLARNNYMLGRLEAIVREAGVNYARRGGPAVLPGDVATMQTWERLRDVSAKEARALLKAMGRIVPQMKETARYDLDALGIEAPMRALPWSVALTEIPEERREYYLACLRRGERLTKTPRIRIETIHGVKGAEADHVMLMTDLSNRTARSYSLAPDNEHRVFYVGATRALQSLHIVLPQTDRFYPV